MRLLIIAMLIGFSLGAIAEEYDVEMDDQTLVDDTKVRSRTTTDINSAEMNSTFDELNPEQPVPKRQSLSEMSNHSTVAQASAIKKVAAATAATQAAPAAMRRPAAAATPQKYFDSEYNVVCYYLPVQTYEGVAQTSMPAISCVKLEDKKRVPAEE